MGPVVRPDVCPQRTSWATDWCVWHYLPLSMGQELLWCVLAFIRAACTLSVLKCRFGWVLAKSISERAGPQETVRAGHEVLARFVLVCSHRGSG